MSRKVIWVFDVISPFAYLALKQLDTLPPDVQIEYVPVLLAGLLKHYGNVGPAEIPAKRRFTYRFALWRAQKMGMEMRMPPAHPFNPLGALRLVIAAGNGRPAIQRVFNAIFRDGLDVADPTVIESLARELRIEDPQTTLAAHSVKQKLHDNTAWAISRGVFGVPTLVIDDEIFWGHDAFEMASDYLADPNSCATPAMQAVDTLPQGSVRRRT